MNVSTLVLFLVSRPRLAESWMYLLEARFCSVWLHALPASLGVVQMSSMHLGPQGHSQAGFPRRHGTQMLRDQNQLVRLHHLFSYFNVKTPSKKQGEGN